MNKIIFNNNTSIDFSLIINTINGLSITFENKTSDELEILMTKNNLSKFQIANSSGEIYGIYNDLECGSITKNLADSSITVNLSKIDGLTKAVNLGLITEVQKAEIILSVSAQ